MFNICNIVYDLFNYCFPKKNKKNKQYNLYFSKYKYPKYSPKLEIIYEK